MIVARDDRPLNRQACRIEPDADVARPCAAASDSGRRLDRLQAILHWLLGDVPEHRLENAPETAICRMARRPGSTFDTENGPERPEQRTLRGKHAGPGRPGARGRRSADIRVERRVDARVAGAGSARDCRLDAFDLPRFACARARGA